MAGQSEQARKLQQEAFVFDGLLSGSPSPAVVDRLLEIGYDSANWTVGGHADSFESLMQNIATYYWLRDAIPDKVHLVRSGADLDAPEHQGKLRVIMGIQGVEPLGKKFHFISILHALGVRILQLTYNDANAVGNGCLEPEDRGLTHFGIQLVREANRLGMIVDVTHAGIKTSLDAVHHSADPVFASHSNARAVRENARNLTDEQMRAIAERGGVIGVATFADFVADTTKGKPNIEQLLDHIDYMVDKIGIDHIGIGTDIFETGGTGGIWWTTNTKRRFPEICGAMDEHMHGVDGFETWEEFDNVTDGLLRRGYSEQDVRKVIGGNFKRVAQQVLR